MKTHLKIKILTLADETKHIKRHELRWKKVKRDGVPHPMFFNLQSHRKVEVRSECRSALLAYGFIRGRYYKKIENKCHERPNWARVEQLVFKFSNKWPIRQQLTEEIKRWSEKIPND